MPSITVNTRVDITIQPWAITASDGSTMTEPVTGTWFTTFDPLYSHPHAVLIEMGGVLSGIPSCTIMFAIYEASRWANIIAVGVCAAPDTAYLTSIRWRYTTLLATIRLLANTSLGISSVIEKTLGDLSIRYGDRMLQKSLIGRLFDELKALEPAIVANGCQGIGSGARPMLSVRGASDPYRPLVARQWMYPSGASPASPTAVYTPAANRGNTLPDRYQRGTPGSLYSRW